MRHEREGSSLRPVNVRARRSRSGPSRLMSRGLWAYPSNRGHEGLSGTALARPPRRAKGENEVKKRLWAVGTAALAYLVMASVALAQDPTQSGYGGTGGNIQGDVEGGTGGGSLPFTGLDLLLLVGAGVLLVAAGLTLRRVGRTTSS